MENKYLLNKKSCLNKINGFYIKYTCLLKVNMYIFKYPTDVI